METGRQTDTQTDMVGGGICLSSADKEHLQGKDLGF